MLSCVLDISTRVQVTVTEKDRAIQEMERAKERAVQEKERVILDNEQFKLLVCNYVADTEKVGGG